MPVFRQATRNASVESQPSQPALRTHSLWYNNNVRRRKHRRRHSLCAFDKGENLSRRGAVSALWWLAELPSLLVFLFYNSPRAPLLSRCHFTKAMC